MQIALLEDDRDQADLVLAWLDEAGHECRLFRNAAEFTTQVPRDGFDLFILDWLLPDSDGLEVLKWTRGKIGWGVPILFVTQRDAREDIVKALETGADDYMPKPVDRRELLARVKALGRRSNVHLPTEQVQTFGAYVIDSAGRTVRHRGEPVELTQKEFDLAVFLFNNLGRVFPRGKLLEHIWGRSPKVNTRTVDTHISRVRKKLRLSPENGWRLSAVYQYGYRLERLGEGD